MGFKGKGLFNAPNHLLRVIGLVPHDAVISNKKVKISALYETCDSLYSMCFLIPGTLPL
jgi:hypothetical protein